MNLTAVTAGEEAAMDIQAFTTLPSGHKVALEAREVAQVKQADSEHQADHSEDQVADWKDPAEDLVVGLEVESRKN